MNKKQISIYILAASLGMGMVSCEKFTDLTPISEATSSTAYSTAKEAEAALTGVYDSYQQEYYIWDNVLFSDVRSDNYYAGGDNPEIFAIDKLEITPTNSRLFSNWSQIYGAIAKANVVIQKVPGITDPALDQGNRRDQIIGEAKFLRAYHYYQLVTLWGGVPLILEPVPSTSPEATHLPRATEEEVYDQIIEDLNDAVTKLPDTYGAADVDKARASKGAANALLAKAWAQRPARDYNKVLEHANAVINSPAGYRLLENYNDLWDGAHYNNSESIMEVQFIGGPEANWGPQLLLPPSISGDSWRKFVTPSHDLVDAFEDEGDEERMNATILFEEAPWSDEYWSLQVGGEVPFAYKWKSANGWASTNRQYLLRLADIILLKAEALNELGQLTEAAAALNQVRQRAGLSPTDADTKEEMRLAILEERRLELAQEAQRWNDLVRYNLMVAVMNNLNEIDLRTGQRVNYNATPNDRLLPIPQLEMNRNPALVQNPGY